MTENAARMQVPTVGQDLPKPVYVSSFNIFGTGTDFGLVLGSVMPDVQNLLVHAANPKSQLTAKLSVEGIFFMSPQAAKDLMLLLSENVAEYEKNFGKLSSPYQQRQSK